MWHPSASDSAANAVEAADAGGTAAHPPSLLGHKEVIPDGVKDTASPVGPKNILAVMRDRLNQVRAEQAEERAARQMAFAFQ